MASFRGGVAALVLIAACLSGPSSAAQPGSPEKAASPVIADWSTLKIGLKRTACYGGCPVYDVEIAGDGTVTYNGRAFVALSGTHVAHIPPEAVQGLFATFAKADFLGALDSYRAHITDQPTFTVTLAFDGHAKQVVDYAGKRIGMPAVISELEAAIDAAAGTARWVKPSKDPFALLQAEGWDFSVTDDDHLGLLVTAAKQGDAAFLGKLLAAGVDARSNLGCQALVAAAYKRNAAMVDALLQAGAPVQSAAPKGEDSKRCAALDAAAGSGMVGIVQAVLARHPDIDAENLSGTTAHMQAADLSDFGSSGGRDYAAVMAALLAAGADPRHADKVGRTALDIASRSPASEAAAEVLKRWMDTHPKGQ